jgi:ABC-type phosphate transport system substrate-binding protein
MQRYFSLDGQELNDRPWASYFGNPELTVYNSIEPLMFQPKAGGGWGYLCPVLEDRKTGNILELCFEEWRSSAAGREWEDEHIAECKPAYPSFEHNIDKMVVPLVNTSEFSNEFGEPIEILSGALGFEGSVGASELDELVKLDNEPFKEKEPSASDPGARYREPELGYGCGRDSSTVPSEWALIGVSNGTEEWGAGKSQTKLFGSIVSTSFEPRAIEISPETATGVTVEQATLAGTINPYGFPTGSMIEYGKTRSPEHTTAEVRVGTGTRPASVERTLTGLSPGTTYYYQVKAFHGEGESESDISYGPLQSFTTAVGACAGSNVTGQGGPELGQALEGVWRSGFNTSKDQYACSGTQGSKGKPTVAYESTSSGAGLESWESSSFKYGATNAFIGTAEPPSAAGIADIEHNEEAVTSEAVETIPIAQISIPIIVNLPSGCTATSKAAEGRLALSDATFQGIFAGTIKTWSELTEDGDAISGTGCNTATPITRVVPSGRAGTTHILKRYLAWINSGKLTTESEASKTWDELSEGALNTAWPKAAAVVKAAGTVAKVAETPGSIGYGSLAEIRSAALFSGASGGPGHPRFWVELENTSKKGKATYADPSSDGDVGEDGEANCGKTVYTNGSDSFPPLSVNSAWNEVSTEVSSASYSLCGLAYVLALNPYSAFPGTKSEEAETVKNFLQFAVDKAGGQKEIAGHDYMALPSDLLPIAKAGAEKVGP